MGSAGSRPTWGARATSVLHPRSSLARHIRALNRRKRALRGEVGRGPAEPGKAYSGNAVVNFSALRLKADSTDFTTPARSRFWVMKAS